MTEVFTALYWLCKQEIAHSKLRVGTIQKTFKHVIQGIIISYWQSSERRSVEVDQRISIPWDNNG